MSKAWLRVLLFSIFTIAMYLIFGYVGLLISLLGYFLEA